MTDNVALEDKLIAALAEFTRNLDFTVSVNQIEQCFIDEGYRKVFGEPVELDPKDEIHDFAEIRRMTGQEWYDRFEKEVFAIFDKKNRARKIPTVYSTTKLYVEAAQRAAGLDG